MISQVKCMTVAPHEIQVPEYLEAELDLGEGSVIQMAIVQKFPLVVIDEKQGRRIARLHGLRITGSLGILVKAAKQGLIDDLGACFPIATKLRWMGESGGFLKQTADGFQERSGADELADF
jgi:predicted nucleic acid-binding protein